MDTSDRHGFTLYQGRGGPKFELGRVKVRFVASAERIPGGVLRCDGTWILRFRTFKNEERDEIAKERAEAVAERLGLELQETEVSATLASAWTLR